MRSILLIMVVLLIMHSYSAVAFDGSLMSASYLDINTRISGTIMASYEPRSTLTELRVSYSLFPKKEYSDPGYYDIRLEPDAQVNDNIDFRWADLMRQYDYSINTLSRHHYVGNTVHNPVRFPIREVPEDVVNYTLPTGPIDSDNPNIIGIAQSIAEGESDLIELQLKIAGFVRDEIRYDLSTLQAEARLTASETLMAKEGVCREITLLFIAINRALNIPARYVSGYAYTNVLGPQGDWAGHAWAEVWIDNKWVPFDVTYGEYLHVSPVHIPFAKTLGGDNSKTSFEWKASRVDIVPTQPTIDVSVNRKGPPIIFGSIVADPIISTVGNDSYNVIRVRVHNYNDYAIAPRIMLGKTQGLELLEDEITVLLYPNEYDYVYFPVRINDSLRRGYVYTFPIVAYSQGFEDARTVFQATYGTTSYSLSYFDDYLNDYNPVYFEDIIMECHFKDKYVAGQSTMVDCNIMNMGNINYDNIRVCLDDCIDMSIGIQESLDFGIMLNADNGMNTAIILAYDNGRLILRESYAYEGVMPIDVSMEFVHDNMSWPGGNIIISASSPIQGTLEVVLSGGYSYTYSVMGEYIDIPISFPVYAYNSFNPTISFALYYDDATGNNIEHLEPVLTVEKSFINRLRIMLGSIVSFFY